MCGSHGHCEFSLNVMMLANGLTLSIRLAALCAIAQASAMAHSVAKHMQRVLLYLFPVHAMCIR